SDRCDHASRGGPRREHRARARPRRDPQSRGRVRAPPRARVDARCVADHARRGLRAGHGRRRGDGERALMARFVLVHGAFSGGWTWDPIADALRAAGHTVIAPDLPGSGNDYTPAEQVTLDGYAQRVQEALEDGDEPALLVGHSMGGVAITHAA